MRVLRQSVFWRGFKRVAADPLRRRLVRLMMGNKIPLMWFDSANWGDALCPVLVRLLSGRPVYRVDNFYADSYMAIGSILAAANSRVEVWGSGFMEGDQKVIGVPRAIHAVRGPLTRTILLKQGIDCPEIYGDPALVLPKFYNPAIPKRYSVAIIPHYIDKSHPWVNRWKDDPGVKVIDVEGDIWDFIRDIKSSAVVVSSSLHGLICADAYGVPNTWVRLSDGVTGGDFKFLDYRTSIGLDHASPIRIAPDTSLTKATDVAEIHELKINLRKLLLACPFLSSRVREKVESWLPGVPTLLPDTFEEVISCGAVLPSHERLTTSEDTNPLRRPEKLTW